VRMLGVTAQSPMKLRILRSSVLCGNAYRILSFASRGCADGASDSPTPSSFPTFICLQIPCSTSRTLATINSCLTFCQRTENSNFAVGEAFRLPPQHRIFFECSVENHVISYKTAHLFLFVFTGGETPPLQSIESNVRFSTGLTPSNKNLSTSTDFQIRISRSEKSPSSL